MLCRDNSGTDLWQEPLTVGYPWRAHRMGTFTSYPIWSPRSVDQSFRGSVHCSLTYLFYSLHRWLEEMWSILAGYTMHMSFFTPDHYAQEVVIMHWRTQVESAAISKPQARSSTQP